MHMATDIQQPSSNPFDMAMHCAATEDGQLPLDFDLLVRRCMGRIELVDRLLTSFEDRFPRELSQIEECLAAGDIERLTRLTHQLKGTAANVSAPRLLAIATKMEETARARQLEEFDGCLSDIRSAWDQFKEYKASLPRVLGAKAVTRQVGN